LQRENSIDNNGIIMARLTAGLVFSSVRVERKY